MSGRDSARINTAKIFKDMVKSDTVEQPYYRACRCNSSGTAVLTDSQGNETINNVTVGEIIPYQVVLFKVASTASLIGLN